MASPNPSWSAESVTVLVVDDQAPFRAAARFVIRATAGMEVAGEVETGEEAVAMAESLRPRLVLMDINLPGISGIEATRQIVDGRPETAVLLMSTYSAEDLPVEARSCGARGYVHKSNLTPDVLLAVVDGTAPAGF
ncbi:MAG TPA: response regulator transcription factor [Jiangellales bacterium]|jgi:two-component system invasion response regulator UvrY|nr:response regulator transcription factor [Jiangellales bacterium]